MNKAFLIGRLTKDVDLRYTPNGTAVASFTLAVDRTFKNSKGEKETDFIPCIVFGKTAEICANFLDKGKMAGIDGRIQTRNYDGKDGKKVYVLAKKLQYIKDERDEFLKTELNSDKLVLIDEIATFIQKPCLDLAIEIIKDAEERICMLEGKE